MESARRSPILFIAVPLLVLACGIVAFQWSEGKNRLPMRDFVEYWSASRAFLDRRNPYDPPLLLALQREALGDPAIEQPVMMWNPPWTLVLLAPFGEFSPLAAHILWLVVQFAAVFASIAMLLRAYDMPKDRRYIGFIAGLIFCPFFLLLAYGQIAGFCLLGLAGFLYFDKRQQPMTAGAFAALTALKPHLLFAFGLALLLNATVSPRGRRTLLGGGLALLAAAIAVWLFNPMIYGYYFDSIRAPSSGQHISVQDWHQPIFSYWLRVAIATHWLTEPIDPKLFWVQFVPTILASAALILLWLRSRQPVDWPTQFPRLILISVLCAAYGAWMFDLVVLVVPVIQATVRLTNAYSRKRAAVIALAGIYFLFNLLTSIGPVIFALAMGLHEFIFFAPAILVLYWLASEITCEKSHG